MEAKNRIWLKIILPIIVMATALTGNGQALEIPQNEFTLSFSKNQLELARGEKGELKILILKSNGYKKSKAKMGVSSSLPKGVTVTFSPDKGAFDASLANISVQADAIPGEYMLILNATLSNKTKASILKLLVN